MTSAMPTLRLPSQLQKIDRHQFILLWCPAYVCEQLTQCHYLSAKCPGLVGVKPTTFKSQVQHRWATLGLLKLIFKISYTTNSRPSLILRQKVLS